MAVEEDTFDIDITGDGADDLAGADDEIDYYDDDEHTFTIEEPQPKPPPVSRSDSKQSFATADVNGKSAMSKTMDGTNDNRPVAPSQGVKRKGSRDDGLVDPGATTALMVSELHWWITEDDIRGWVNEVNAEDDLNEIIFSEHKYRQAYLDFTSPQASSVTKHKIEALAKGSSTSRKFSVTFTNGSHNPFKTSPKDAPARAKDDRSPHGGSSAYTTGRGDYGDRGGFRGRVRGFGRGEYNNSNFNRNFSGPAGGYNNGGGYQGNQGNMGMMNSFNYNRGGMMGNNMRGNMGTMRGGRGGMNNMMQMGGMGMGMGNMGMNPMMAGIGMAGFGAGMFNQGANDFGGDWGPPGNKRQRQD